MLLKLYSVGVALAVSVTAINLQAQADSSVLSQIEAEVETLNSFYEDGLVDDFINRFGQIDEEPKAAAPAKKEAAAPKKEEAKKAEPKAEKKAEKKEGKGAEAIVLKKDAPCPCTAEAPEEPCPCPKPKKETETKIISLPLPPPPEPAPPPTVTPTIVDGCPGKIDLQVEQPPAPPKKIHSHTINLTTGEQSHTVREADD